MASYHCSIKKPLSRGKGQSLMAKAAYNARTQYEDERTGTATKDYAYKGGLLDSFVAFDPKTNAPEWVKTDPQRLLNAAVAAEKRSDAREAQEIVFGYIHELGPQKNRWMLNDFIREQLTRGTGRVVIGNIHAPSEHGDQRNMHAHVLLLLREIGPDGFGERLAALEPEDYQHIRQKWAEKGAKELRKAGFELEADRYAEGWRDLEQQRRAALERGDAAYAETLNREATTHRGPAVDAMERQGQQTERGNVHRDTQQRTEQQHQDAAALKIELAGIQKAIADYERQWADQLANAAIEKEKIERRFVEPPPRQANDRQQENKWPMMPPPQQPVRTSPALHFEDAAQGATRQEAAPSIPANLRGTAAQIWTAYNVRTWEQERKNADGELVKVDIQVKGNRDPYRFAAALEEKGIALAVVTKAEAEHSEKEAAHWKAHGERRPTYREGEFVVVNKRGDVYQLTNKNTGDDRQEAQRFLAKAEWKGLKGIDATKEVMQTRATEREGAQQTKSAEFAAARLKRATNIRSNARSARTSAANDNQTAAVLKRGGRRALRLAGAVVHVAADAFSSLFAPPAPKTAAQIDEDHRRYENAAAQSEKVAEHDAKIERHEEIKGRHHEEAREQKTTAEQHERLNRDRDRGGRDR